MTPTKDAFVIERILAHKIIRGRRVYLLKWKGYPDSDNTWEPEENVLDNKLLKIYKQRNDIASESESDDCTVSSSFSSSSSSGVENGCENTIPNFESDSSMMSESDLGSIRMERGGETLHCAPTRVGFDRGLEPEKILGATNEFGNELMFLIKWRGTEEGDLVYAREAHEKCPQLVINFFEENLSWAPTLSS